MEEEKLLRFLIIIVISIIYTSWGASQVAMASFDLPEIDDTTRDWTAGIANRDRESMLNSFKEIMEQPGFDQELKQQVLNPRPSLQVFVSSGLPKSMLKSYAREARRYGGVLVLRGLPDGSMHKLTDLVMEISEEETAAMQIDDEAFSTLEIKRVPAIVLSQPSTIFTDKNQADVVAKFDKITGSITIKAALELFKSSGSMSVEARSLLK